MAQEVQYSMLNGVTLVAEFFFVFSRKASDVNIAYPVCLWKPQLLKYDQPNSNQFLNWTRLLDSVENYLSI